ncbi:TetR family transcriptional regulator [Nocardia sp. BMG51109]|uniref:TetR family transcriptional regulator n=1 Tax=Nocardia sp. BMG51109 TaxID=1056816 RepID=UPI000467C117|nr:TetR family transcriptional regulator [Nocardia sp. BMG51109]
MSRWEPNARGRLERAAMELYGERGFEATTVAEIARRAGLTERTFFRHFADKREVLFGGAALLEDMLVKQVAAVPMSVPPLAAVGAALDHVAATVFDEERRGPARLRQAIIDAHPDLRERESIKMASLSGAVGRALRERGVAEPAASLAADAGMAVFRVGFERWIGDSGTRPLPEYLAEAVSELRRVAGEPA